MLIAASFGLGLAFMPKTENRETLLKGILGFQELLFTLIKALLYILPVGILAFAAQLSAQIEAGVIVGALGKYTLVIIGSNCIQFFLVLPVFLLLRGLNPISVFRKMSPAIAVALFTKSSAGTLPVTLASAETNLKADPAVSLLCPSNLHDYQHERLCSFHSRYFPVRYAECRIFAGYADYADMARRCCHCSHRQCGRSDGMLFPDTVSYERYRCTNRTHGYHSSNLYNH